LKELSEDMERNFIFTGCILMALAVVAGAFGAHALQPLLDERYSHTYQTAVTYHVYHALALLLIGILHPYAHQSLIKLACRFFLVGLILFCGSLYTLTLLIAIVKIRFSWLGAITPFGGVCFIVGWVLLAISVKKGR
jgi:uncharacterized membrane protein YgdD (TMEM256/DUF423 family)